MNVQTRVTKLEHAYLLNAPRYITGLMDYDERGNPAMFELKSQTFTALPGESENDLVARGRAAVGDETSDFILVQFVRAENGRLAPGYSRFAK